MNFILPLLSFFMGSAKNLFKEPGVALTQQVVMHVRSLSLVIISCIGSLALFCVGVSLLIAKLAGQVDADEGFSFTSGMIVYSAMVIVSAGVLTYALRKDTWLKAVGFEQKPTEARKSGALESAVALLVMDFVEERQNRRKKTDDSDSAEASA
ncbi:hypothetical protein D3C87_190330 [compost metagenome]